MTSTDPVLPGAVVRRRSLLPLLIPLALPVLLGAGIAADQKGKRSPAQIYRSACASCHGDDGKGMPGHAVGFDTPLPDFTDCKFATREPDADWAAIAHHGGPVRAFDKLMPAFGEAVREADVLQALKHVRSFCHERRSWPRGELNLPRPLVTGKAFPEDEAVIATSVDAEAKNSVMSKLVYERRIGARGQVEVILPFGFVETDEDGWTGGIGDIGLATKWALLHSVRTGSILSLALELFLPTGREDRGLGKGVTALEPFVAYGQMLPHDGFVQLQVGAELSTEPSIAAHEVFWRAALGVSLAEHGFGRAWSPMIEVLGAREIEDEAVVNWDLAPQVQVTLSTRQHVRVGAGLRIPVNDFHARSTYFMMYLLWDWYDGALTEGW